MGRPFTFLLLLAAILVGSCGGEDGLPRDENLETFIEVSARCAYIERAFSHEPDVLVEEMSSVEFPENWDSLVDSLLNAYGTDPGFWSKVYTEIVERSRR
jgi:hypothetical protein